MSRIGKLPITIPSNVDIICNDSSLIVKGEFGELNSTIPEVLSIKKIDNILSINLKTQTRTGRSLHGLYRTLINNMIIGVSKQFEINLNLTGVGYRANVQGSLLNLNLGYSHIVKIDIPEDIKVKIEQNTQINLKSYDKEKLGLFEARIRSWRPPEPYKGKGISYEGEIIRRKAGKSGKT